MTPVEMGTSTADGRWWHSGTCPWSPDGKCPDVGHAAHLPVQPSRVTVREGVK